MPLNVYPKPKQIIGGMVRDIEFLNVLDFRLNFLKIKLISKYLFRIISYFVIGVYFFQFIFKYVKVIISEIIESYNNIHTENTKLFSN